MSICNLDHFEGSYFRGKPFVLVSGCFDPLHEGHLSLFEEARRHGPVVVALAPDAEVAQKRTPCLPEMTRLKVLNACALVEHVTLAAVPAVIRALKPTHYIVGDDWKDGLPKETLLACLEASTQVLYVSTRENSSTALLADYERRRNAEKLAALERFVQEQPAPDPWTPVTDYSWEARREIEKPHAEILKAIFPGCSMLDYGCGFGYLVRLLCGLGVDAHGWDPQGTQWPPPEDADLVICREVLEHVSARWIADEVAELVSYARRFVYVTTRFTAKSHLLDVDGADDLDPTHCTMLNQDYLRSLFVMHGCTRRADLEQRLDWMQKGRCLVYEVPRG